MTCVVRGKHTLKTWNLSQGWSTGNLSQGWSTGNLSQGWSTGNVSRQEAGGWSYKMVGSWPKIGGRWDFEVGCVKDRTLITR